MPKKFFEHSLLLRKGVCLLLDEVVQYNDIKIAEELLDLYYLMYDEYYGKNTCRV